MKDEMRNETMQQKARMPLILRILEIQEKTNNRL